MAHPPAVLQAVLKSTAIEDLDLQKNKAYIVHQILALGTWEQIAWMLKYYGVDTVRDTFQTQPMKLYSPEALHFSQLILDVSETQIRSDHYDKTSPRDIG